MKKSLLISAIVFLCATWSCLVRKEKIRALYELQASAPTIPTNDSFSIVQAPSTDGGNAEAGYRYLTQGNEFNTGIPIGIYRIIKGLKNTNIASVAGYSKFAINDFIVFRNNSGTLSATPGCLYCHAQQFDHKLIVGLGNSYSNFQGNMWPYLASIEKMIKMRYGRNSNEWKSAGPAFAALHVLKGHIQTQAQGPTPAQKIGEVMASHRDPVSLKFRADTSYFPIPNVVIPEDVPALWITKKRKAFTVNAMRQGSFLKHLASPTIIAFKDSAEAKDICDHMMDVWAYMQTLEAPRYPLPIDKNLASKGKKIFTQECARCHGRYDTGESGEYPNILIPEDEIGTDSLMLKYFLRYPESGEWFNKSWFATSAAPAFLRPQPGYVAPPLDGVWITAPYFHNGSVPTIENVLNSKSRPRYWRRNFRREEYDYQKLGWKCKKLSRPAGRRTYNTDLPGYGNYGHPFGDHLSDGERKAVIEYLKTL